MQALSRWHSYWQSITEPAPGISGEERQQVRLLITLALSLLLIGPPLIVAWVVTSPDFTASRYISLGLYLALVAIYALSRTRGYGAGAYLLIAVLLALVAATIVTAPGLMFERMLALKFLLVAILIASMLLSIRATLVVTALCVGGTLWFLSVPGVPFAIVYSYLVFELVMSALLITAASLRNVQVLARRQAEAALRESEARYRTLADRNGVGIWQVTPDGQTTYLNPAMCALLGVSGPEALHGRSFHEFFTPASLARHSQLPADTGLAEGYEVELIRTDGGRRNLIVYDAPLLAEDGSLRSLIGTFVDITERKRLEDQVVQSQKMEAIGRLAGGVAHDLNNLLTVINGYADLLLTSLAADDPHRQELSEIAAAGGQAAALTRQLLTFSRQNLPEAATASLNEAVCQAEKMLRRVIGEDVDLEVSLCPTDCYVRVSPEQLSQILLNLAVNARDAMPRGGRLTIATRVEPAEGGQMAVLLVSDTGHGMGPEVQARLFEPFFTTKGPGGGTGLGLAVVHGIVLRAGGAITVESAPGQGARFRLALPACEPAAAAAAAAAPLAARGGSETVLLVEDDPAVRQLAERSLAGQGYRVLAVANGAEALGLPPLDLASVALVLTDVVMPGQSGPELVAALRQAAPQLQVIYMSGYAPETTLRHGMVAEARGFLAKPFTAASLARLVREALDS